MPVILGGMKWSEEPGFSPFPLFSWRGLIGVYLGYIVLYHDRHENNRHRLASG